MSYFRFTLKTIITVCLILLPLNVWAFGLHLGFINFGGSQQKQHVDLVPNLTWTPVSKDYGSQNIGTNTDQAFTLTNTGNTLAESISLAVSGTGYTLLSTTCGSNPFDLAESATCTATARFTPASAGTLTGSLTASRVNRDDVVAGLTGVGVVVDPYTLYFSNNFGCADSGTVYTCANPDVFTSETDTSSQGAISNNTYLLTYSASSTDSYVTKSSLTPHGDVSLRFRFNPTSKTPGLSIVMLAGLYSSTGPLFTFGASTIGDTFLTHWRTVSYAGEWGGSASVNFHTFAFQDGVNYDVVINIKLSTTSSSADGNYTLIVNNNTVATVSNLNMYASTLDKLTFGITGGSTITDSFTLDNLWMGYK
jgi:hypothetical protein